MYYRGAAAAIVVYDITNKESFNGAKSWVKELQRRGDPNVVIALAGNKADLQDKRKVEIEEATMYAEENNILHMETSAREATNVRHLFQEIGKRSHAKPTARHPPLSHPRVRRRLTGRGPRLRRAQRACCRRTRRSQSASRSPSSLPRAGRRSRAAHSRDARRRMASYDTAIRFCRAAVCSRALSSWCAHRCTGVWEGFCCMSRLLTSRGSKVTGKNRGPFHGHR